MAKGFKKPKEPKGPKYEHASEHVLKMAARLVDKYHPHLAEARIRYLLRNGKWIKKGNTVLGNAKLASEDVRFLGECDFVIVINKKSWEGANETQQHALLDHQLTHCVCDYDKAGNKKWATADHDVNDFVSIVKRHGFWDSDLIRLKAAISQIGLFDEDNVASEIQEEILESIQEQIPEPISEQPDSKVA